MWRIVAVRWNKRLFFRWKTFIGQQCASLLPPRSSQMCLLFLVRPTRGRSMGDVLSPQSFGALLLRLGAMIRPTASGRLLFLLCNNGRTELWVKRDEHCRDARSVRPLCQSETSSRSFDNGRTDRASLQDSVTVRPYRIQLRLDTRRASLLTLSCYRADTVVCTSSKNNSSFGTF